MAQKILIVDDTPANMAILVDLLEPQGYIVSAAPNGLVGLTVAAKLLPDIILLDIMMPDLDGLETCRRLKAEPRTAPIPVLFISARDDAASILAGFQAGGADFVVKPFQAEEVLARVNVHLHLSSLTRELQARNEDLSVANRRLVAEINRRRQADEALHAADRRLLQIADSEARHWGIEQFVGKSETLLKILATIRRLANFSTVSTLITGESGSGKERVARAIHYATPVREGRTRGAFVVLNCVAIPDELAESALFGHPQGALPGPTADHPGLLAQADGGTLFFDEIAAMPLAIQTKLLRVLEDGQFLPLGSTEPIQTDMRVLAATNGDLPQLIAAGRFRSDLYDRLSQSAIHVPALRERRQDIPLLAQHFLKVFSHDMRLKGAGITPEALAVLQNYQFPGNVRELKNIIERALIESGGREIDTHHLQLGNIIADAVPKEDPAPQRAAPQDLQLPLNLEKAEALLIQRALAQTGGNIARAARLLGINRSRIYRTCQ